MRKLIFCTLLFFIASPVDASPSDNALFDQVFSHWTTAFNHKSINQTCSLFSKSVIADYKGFPTKNYTDICNGFKKIFAQPHLNYQYRYKLHDVYHSGNLAAIRVTWYLSVYKNNKLISTSQDEGIDVIAKNAAGQWQIINYLAYEV